MAFLKSHAVAQALYLREAVQHGSADSRPQRDRFILLPESEKAKKPQRESFRLSASQARLNITDKNELPNSWGDFEEQLRT